MQEPTITRFLPSSRFPPQTKKKQKPQKREEKTDLTQLQAYGTTKSKSNKQPKPQIKNKANKQLIPKADSRLAKRKSQLGGKNKENSLVRRCRGFWRASTKKGSTIDSLSLNPCGVGSKEADSMEERCGKELGYVGAKEGKKKGFFFPFWVRGGEEEEEEEEEEGR